MWQWMAHHIFLHEPEVSTEFWVIRWCHLHNLAGVLIVRNHWRREFFIGMHTNGHDRATRGAWRHHDLVLIEPLHLLMAHVVRVDLLARPMQSQARPVGVPLLINFANHGASLDITCNNNKTN
jgi:hypothetical protein